MLINFHFLGLLHLHVLAVAHSSLQRCCSLCCFGFAHSVLQCFLKHRFREQEEQEWVHRDSNASYLTESCIQQRNGAQYDDHLVFVIFQRYRNKGHLGFNNVSNAKDLGVHRFHALLFVGNMICAREVCVYLNFSAPQTILTYPVIVYFVFFAMQEFSFFQVFKYATRIDQWRNGDGFHVRCVAFWCEVSVWRFKYAALCRRTCRQCPWFERRLWYVSIEHSINFLCASYCIVECCGSVSN